METIETIKEKKLSFARSTLLLPLIIGLALIISTLIGGIFYYRAKTLDNALSVTGSAKIEVSADTGKWVAQLTRLTRVSTLRSGYADIARDLDTVKKFLRDKGIADTQIVIGPVFMDQNYDTQATPGIERDYTLRETIEVTSSDVNQINTLSKDISTLINQGVLIATSSVEYYYSKLPEARISLLADAMQDAQARAAKIAEATGKHIGSIRSASSGVVQVLPHNSVDISDYGSYDTSQIEKEITLTVKASFTLK